ncbi:MAG TPA: TetR/AcrR family transcriptional regulator [Gemmatimonadales bacterium]|jgi:AcrR family transcriptional regulator|nr:TetR/AcrR family transcriptional regulator [Gemmatimonadales bacterium]
MADRNDAPTPETPRWQRRPTERRREILDAAALVFGEHGFESATLALVAERAGVSSGTVQHYFGTKTALFQEVITDRFFSSAAEDEALLINHRGSYSQLLRALLTRTWTRLRRPGTADLMLAGMASAGNCPEAGRVVSGEVAGRFPRVLQGVIQAGVEGGEFHPVNAEQLARVLGAAMKGLVVGHRRMAQFCPGAPAPEPDGAMEELLQLVERGLVKAEGTDKERQVS